MKVVAVFSVKGGVGKTSTAVNLAWSAARTRKTLLWDLDPQGGATFLTQTKARPKTDAKDLVRGRTGLRDLIRSTADERLDVAPAHASFASLDLELDDTKKPGQRLDRILAPLAKRYDIGVLDCPPGMSLLSESILVAADVIVVPLVPSPLAMRALDQVTTMLGELKRSSRPEIIGFLSMVDRRKTVHRELVAGLPAADAHVHPVIVPYSTHVERMGIERAPVAAFAPRSAPAMAYVELWSVVERSLGR